MILHLVKRDFLIIKKYLWMIVLLVALTIPISLSVRQLIGAGALLLASTFTMLMYNQVLAMSEYKYPKVEALLCSTPYSRKNIVVSRYVSFLILFLICCALYGGAALALPSLASFSVGTVLTALLATSLICGICIPIQYKFGVIKTQLAFRMLLLLISFGTPIVLSIMEEMDLSMLDKIPMSVQYIILTTLSIAIIAISICVSKRIYEKKEL